MSRRHNCRDIYMNIYLIILLNNLVKMTDLASFVYRFIFDFSLLIKQLIVIVLFAHLWLQTLSPLSYTRFLNLFGKKMDKTHSKQS